MIFSAYMFSVACFVNVKWLLCGYFAAIIYTFQWCDDFEDLYSSSYYYSTCSFGPVTVWAIVSSWFYECGSGIQRLAIYNYVANICCACSNATAVDQKVSQVVVTHASPSRIDEGASKVENVLHMASYAWVSTFLEGVQWVTENYCESHWTCK